MPERGSEYEARAAELAEARWHRIEAEAETERAEHQRRLNLVQRLKRTHGEHVPFAALDEVLPPERKGKVDSTSLMKGTT